MKIVIVNQHTCNRGDEAAGRAVIDSLLKTFPDCTIDVLYRFIGEYPPIWDNSDRVHHYPEFQYNYDKKRFILFYLEIILNFIFGILKFKNLYIGSTGQIYKIIANADIVINAPTGPNIGDIYKDKFYMLNLIFACISGKKTFMYASSVGPFNIPWIRKWAKFLFNRMAYICVREDISLKYLKDLDLKNKNITSSIDAAIQRKIDGNRASELYQKAHLELNKYNVGITPLAYFMYPKEFRNEEIQKLVEQNLVHIIDKITENGDTNIFFFPQLFSIIKDDEILKNDMPIIKSIISKVKKADFCRIVPNNYDSDMQQKMISKLDYFLGMRYHSIIFSVKMGIPAVGICYEHKASGFLEKAGLKELAVDFKDFLDNSDIVLKKINYIKSNKDYLKNVINTNINDLSYLSGKGTRIIKEYIDKTLFL